MKSFIFLFLVLIVLSSGCVSTVLNQNGGINGDVNKLTDYEIETPEQAEQQLSKVKGNIQNIESSLDDTLKDLE